MQIGVTARPGHQLFDDIAHDRFRQFVTRHGWELFATTDGREIDEYDDSLTEYAVARAGGRHVCSCRLRPARHGTMIEAHFSRLFPATVRMIVDARAELFEITRFCRAPGYHETDYRELIASLGEELMRMLWHRRARGYVAVVFAPVARLMKRNGVRFEVLEEAEIDGRRCLAVLITGYLAS